MIQNNGLMMSPAVITIQSISKGIWGIEWSSTHLHFYNWLQKSIQSAKREPQPPQLESTQQWATHMIRKQIGSISFLTIPMVAPQTQKASITSKKTCPTLTTITAMKRGPERTPKTCNENVKVTALIYACIASETHLFLSASITNMTMIQSKTNIICHTYELNKYWCLLFCQFWLYYDF